MTIQQRRANAFHDLTTQRDDFKLKVERVKELIYSYHNSDDRPAIDVLEDIETAIDYKS